MKKSKSEINKRVMNNLSFIGLVSFLLLLAFLIIYFLPNQLAWKVFTVRGQFDTAQKAYSKWGLAVRSNKLDSLYKNKQYTLLSKKLQEIKDSDCSLKNESISAFCENVFYLDGITNYRLGEAEQNKIRDELWQSAIKDFQYALNINPENTWAKENIEFILRKKMENEGTKNGKPTSGNTKTNEGAKNAQSSETGTEAKKQAGNTDNNKQTGKGAVGEQGDKNNGKNQSRLPKQIQQALEQRQKELENAQKNQSGFARSASKARQNKEESEDPFSVFENDPFFKDFFGNDPFFSSHHRRNLRKTLSNPDEKDW